MNQTTTLKRHGSGHWWGQKFLTVSLLPLTAWYVYIISLHIIPGMDNTQMLSSLLNELVQFKFALIAPLCVFLLTHCHLSLHGMLDDYVHNDFTNRVATISLTIITLKTAKFLLLFLMQ